MVVVDLEVLVDLETIQEFSLLLVVLAIHKDLQHLTDQDKVIMVLQTLALVVVQTLEHLPAVHHLLVVLVDQEL